MRIETFVNVYKTTTVFKTGVEKRQSFLNLVMKRLQDFCKNCGKRIDPKKGRADRKYCDERCKNQYHNARNNEENSEVQRIELILRKNHRILKKMFLRKDRDEIERERLLKEGFHFDFHTHHVISKTKGYEYTFSFGYGFRELPQGGRYKIVKAFEPREEL